MHIHGFYRTSKMVPIKLLKRLPDLLEVMLRNRMAMFVDYDNLEVHHGDRAYSLSQDISTFCEEHIKDRWSFEYDSWWTDSAGDIADDNVLGSDIQGCKVHFKVLFETTQDADLFVSNYLVPRKLAS